MAPFPETEIMTLKRLEVALRKTDFKLLKDGAYKLHEKFHGGHRFEYVDLLKEIYSNIIGNASVPRDIKDILIPTIEDIFNVQGIETYKPESPAVETQRVSSLTSLSYGSNVSNSIGNTQSAVISPQKPDEERKMSAYDAFGSAKAGVSTPNINSNFRDSVTEKQLENEMMNQAMGLPTEEVQSVQKEIEAGLKNNALNIENQTGFREASFGTKPFTEFSPLAPVEEKIKEPVDREIIKQEAVETELSETDMNTTTESVELKVDEKDVQPDIQPDVQSDIQNVIKDAVQSAVSDISQDEVQNIIQNTQEIEKEPEKEEVNEKVNEELNEEVKGEAKEEAENNIEKEPEPPVIEEKRPPVPSFINTSPRIDNSRPGYTQTVYEPQKRPDFVSTPSFIQRPGLGLQPAQSLYHTDSRIDNVNETKENTQPETEKETTTETKTVSVFFGQDGSRDRSRDIIRLREMISKAGDEHILLDETLKLISEIKTRTNTSVVELRTILGQFKNLDNKINLVTNCSSSGLIELLEETETGYSFVEREEDKKLNLIPMFGLSNLFSCANCSETYLNVKSDVEPLILSCPKCKAPMYPTLYAADGLNAEINANYYNYSIKAFASSKVWLLIHPGLNDIFTVNLLRTALSVSNTVEEIYILDKDINVRETYKKAFVESTPEGRKIFIDTQMNALEIFFNSIK